LCVTHRDLEASKKAEYASEERLFKKGLDLNTINSGSRCTKGKKLSKIYQHKVVVSTDHWEPEYCF